MCCNKLEHIKQHVCWTLICKKLSWLSYIFNECLVYMVKCIHEMLTDIYWTWSLINIKNIAHKSMTNGKQWDDRACSNVETLVQNPLWVWFPICPRKYKKYSTRKKYYKHLTTCKFWSRLPRKDRIICSKGLLSNANLTSVERVLHQGGKFLFQRNFGAQEFFQRLCQTSCIVT